MSEPVPVLSRCEFCGSPIVAKRDKSKQGRYKRYCGQTCKNKANKIGYATNLTAKRSAILAETKEDRCIDCGTSDVIVKVGNKAFCARCLDK